METMRAVEVLRDTLNTVDTNDTVNTVDTKGTLSDTFDTQRYIRYTNGGGCIRGIKTVKYHDIRNLSHLAEILSTETCIALYTKERVSNNKEENSQGGAWE